MKTRAEIFAVMGESLTAAAIFWIVEATAIFGKRAQAYPDLIWSVLLCLFSVFVYTMFLKKERSPFGILILSAVLVVAAIAVLLLAENSNINGGYVFSQIVAAGFNVLPAIYLILHKQELEKHIVFFDAMVALFVWLCLNSSVLDTSAGNYALALIIILTDIAGAIGLRMNEGGLNEGTGKAFALAFGCAAATAAVVFVLVMLFSRSGSITSAFISGAGLIIGKIGDGLNSFFTSLFGLFKGDYSETEAVSSVDGIEMDQARSDAIVELSVNPTFLFIIALIVAAVAVVIYVVLIRKKRIRFEVKAKKIASPVKMIRKKNPLRKRWEVFLRELKFRKTAFIERNTSPGVLVWLETKAKRSKNARLKGESIRDFVMRLAPDGQLASLADDMENCLYGNGRYSLSKSSCRELKKVYRSIIRTEKNRKKKEKKWQDLETSQAQGIQ